MIISCFFLFHEDCYPGFSLFSCHDSFSLQCRHTIDHSSLRLRAAALSETLLRHLVQGSLSVWLPQGCSNRSPSLPWLKKLQIYLLTALEARSPKWRCQQGLSLWNLPRRMPLASPQPLLFPAALGIPCLIDAKLWSPPLSSQCVLLRVCLCAFSFLPVCLCFHLLMRTPITESVPTLYQYDLISTPLHLQKPCSQIRLLHKCWRLGLKHTLLNNSTDDT